MRLIGLDPGHGGMNHGCEANGIHEQSVTLQVALAAARQIAPHKDVAALLSRAFDESVSLPQRAARLAEAERVMVLHVNAAPGLVDACDMRCYVAYDLPAEALAAANRMALATLHAAPAPVKRDPPHVWVAMPGMPTERCYNVLKHHAPKPAVLVELFFATHPASAALFKTEAGIQELATAVVAGALAGMPASSMPPWTEFEPEAAEPDKEPAP